jgi:sec-independent protein translocase protein TatA
LVFADPLQLIVIGIVAVVILLWGPKKIPELARGLGRARREFDEASKAYTDASSGHDVQPATAANPASKVLRDTAVQLGINPEGKTDEEVSKEILSRKRADT